MPFNGKLLSGADKKRKDQKIKILNYQNIRTKIYKYQCQNSLSFPTNNKCSKIGFPEG